MRIGDHVVSNGVRRAYVFAVLGADSPDLRMLDQRVDILVRVRTWL